MAMRVTRNRIWCSLLLAVMTSAWAGQGSQQYRFDIDAAPVARALRQFSEQTGLQIAYFPSSAAEESIIVGPVLGEYTVDAALVELLRPLGARFTWVNERAVVIQSPRFR
jgi:iron complex outermembrane recepter protein